MATYGEMQSTILDEMANDGDLTTEHIKNGILRAIRHYERRPWWFNQKVATFSTVAGQEYYGASDLSDIPNIVRIESALITNTGYKSALKDMDYQSIDWGQTGTDTGVPWYYTVFQNKIRLYPIPDAAYTVTLSYIYKLTELSLDADTNSWTTECEELIRQSAKKRIALDIMQADDLAGRFSILENQALDELLAENRRRRPLKVLQPPAMVPYNSFDIVTGL